MRIKRLITLLLLFAMAPAFGASAERAAIVAQRFIGTPYLWGGTTPAGFDCSGLVQFAYGQAGFDLPRTVTTLQAITQPVDLAQLRKGDLLFFSLRNGTRSHVGIYLGQGTFVHATSRGKTVIYSRLENSYWREHLIHAGRLTVTN